MEGHSSDTILAFDEFTIDATKRLLFKGKDQVFLKSKAFDLLSTLIENRGTILSKSFLMDEVWANQFVEENNLTVHIAALRKALGETKGEHRFIVTVPGQGYKFVGRVDEVDTNGHGSIPPSAAPLAVNDEFRLSDAPMGGAESQFNKWLIAVVALLLLSSLGIGWYVRSHSQKASVGFEVGAVKRLTSSGKIWQAATLSPDGKLFAYALKEGEKEGLWLGHVDGGEPKQILPPGASFFTSLTFAPDGSTLYFTVTPDLENGVLYRLPVFGGVPEKIKESSRGTISFSPDGKQYAFVRDDRVGAKTRLFIADTASGTERQLLAEGLSLEIQSTSWSPDGRSIAVGASPSGSRKDIFLVDVIDGSARQLTQKGWSHILGVKWLHSGDGLITTASDQDSSRDQIWNVSAVDGTATPLIKDLNSYTNAIGVSADDHEVLVVQAQEDSNIWTATAKDMAQAKQITFGSVGRGEGWLGLDWTPDERILYTAITDNNRTIWVMDNDGRNQKQLIPSGGNNLYPQASKDGKYIVFQSNRDGDYAIWRADADGSNLTRLTRTGIAGEPSISPDSKWVYYVTAAQFLGDVYRIPIDGGDPSKITDRPGNWPTVSPDGRFVVCGYEIDGNGKIAVAPAEGGAPLKLFEVPRLGIFRPGFRWTPDGKSVTYLDQGFGVWVQALEGGEPQQMPGLPSERLYAHGWSPDGKMIAFTRGRNLGEVVLFTRAK